MTTRVEIHAPKEHRVHVHIIEQDGSPGEEHVIDRGSSLTTYLWGGRKMEIEEGS